MRAAEHGDEQLIDHFGLPDDDLANLLPQPRVGTGQPSNGREFAFARVALTVIAVFVETVLVSGDECHVERPQGASCFTAGGFNRHLRRVAGLT